MKRKRGGYQKLASVVGIVSLTLILMLSFYALAASFVDDTQTEFDVGTYNNTAWSADHVQLGSGQTSGEYTSQVFDGGDAGTITWNNINWSETLYDAEKLLVVDTAADVWKSTDNGAVWTQLIDDYNGGDGNAGVDGMASDSNKNIFIAHNQKIWKSTNFGASFTAISNDYNGSEAQDALAITADSGNNLYIAEADEDIWKSTDGGSSWTKTASNINGADGDILGMTAVGTTLYVVDADAGIWTSSNGGTTWSQTINDYNGSDGNAGSDGMTSDSLGNIYIVRDQAVWKSTNSGVSWTKINADYNGSENQDATAITIDDDNTLYIAEADEDIWKSTDSGSNWTKTASNINGANGNILGMTAITVNNDLKFQVRSGSVNPPTASFTGPDGTTLTYFTAPSGENPNVSSNRYFQYKGYFSTEDSGVTPRLNSFTITYTSTDGAAPAAIADLAVSNPQAGQVTLSWTAPGDDGNSGTATTYDIRYSTSNITEANWASVNQASGEPVPQVAGTAQTMAVSGLNPSTLYYFAMKTADEVPNTSALSNVVSTSTTASIGDSTAPSSVSNLSATNVDSSNVTLSWTAPGDDGNSGTATTYDIRYSTSNITEANWASVNQASGEPAPQVAGTVQTVAVSGLNPSTLYYFAMKTADEVPNLSSLSNVLSTSTAVTGVDTTPPIISNVSSNSITRISATINWITNEGADSQVEYGSDTSYGLSTALDTNLVISHSVNLGGLTENKVYHYRVKSKDSSGNSSVSPDFTFNTLSKAETPPPAKEPVISDITLADTVATSTFIKWKTDELSTAQIFYGLERDDEFQTKETSQYLAEHSVLLENLKASTTYKYKIRAASNAGLTTVKDGLTFATPLPRDYNPPVLSDIQVLSIRTASVKIGWKTNEPATGQIIFGKEKGNLTEKTIEVGTLSQDHEIALADLAPDTNYYFKIVSRDKENNRATSEEKNFKTQNLEVQTEIQVKKAEAAAVGAQGTKIAQTSLGETSTAVPILPTLGDEDPPIVTIFKFKKNPTPERSPSVEGEATDTKGVIAGMAYSTDNGTTWHPMTKVEGIGTKKTRFGFKILHLEDGNYPIIARARDNSNNIGFSKTQILIVDADPPATGGNVMLLGTQSFISSPTGVINTLTNLTQRIIVAASGGAVSVQLKATPIKKNLDDKTTEPAIFPLTFSKAANLWFADISFASAGFYETEMIAVDGAEKTAQRKINPFQVNEPGKVADPKGHPIAEATVSLFNFDAQTAQWKLWPGEIFNQKNPQITEQNGSYRFLVTPGKYYLKVEKDDIQTFNSRILYFSEHQIIDLNLTVKPRKIIRLAVPFWGELALKLPSFPDFKAPKRTSEAPRKILGGEKEISALINEPAPIFSLPTAKGETLDLRYQRGKKVILTTWTTWSPLAQEEVPILEQISQEHKEDVRVILLSLQEGEGVIESYLRRGGYTIPSVIDKEGQILKLYPILSYPQHFFIDRKGIIRDIHVGFLDKDGIMEKMNNF